MSTAIIAHADRDGIAASALLLRYKEPLARVFPVGRAQDVASMLAQCAKSACPEKLFIVGYHSSVPDETWSALHAHNPRIFWFDHHLDQWRAAGMPPGDMVRVVLPAEGERNAPAAMVARHVFGDVGGMPAEDRDFLRRIYEALPPDEIIEFIDGLHSEIRGARYTEMTDFVKAVNQRRIPPHYQHFLKTARTNKKAFQMILSGGKGFVTDGKVVRLTGIGDLSPVPRAVISCWARGETGARMVILDLPDSRMYVNMRHDVKLSLRAEIEAVPGMRCSYLSGHPYAMYADGCAMDDGSDPRSAAFAHFSGRLGGS